MKLARFVSPSSSSDRLKKVCSETEKKFTCDLSMEMSRIQESLLCDKSNLAC
jgi:hypothetical protein